MSDLFATFGLNGKLLLAQGINFGLVLFVLWRFLYRPVLAMLDERKNLIEKGVQDAESAKAQLAEAGTQGVAIVAQASHTAEELVAAAKTRADQKGSEILGRAEERAESILKDAHQKAEEAARRVLDESKKEVARAAMLAAEKILSGDAKHHTV